MRKVNGLDCILLVDDDEITNLIHKRVIESCGLSVKIAVAKNGREALDYLQGKNEENYMKPNIIFLDINMPQLNGWEFLEQYHNLPEEFKVKTVFVMLTTSADPKDHKRADENPDVNRFVNKTLTAETLEEIIETHFTA